MPNRPSKVISNPARLAALHRAGLLDTPPEDAFDQLTRLASKALQAPIALVNLVDKDRQFFKSSVGLPEPWASRRETTLAHSVCQHVVTTGERLVVEDARTEPLLKGNLAMRDLGVVAYAGVPLRTREGDVLGTLCVIDDKPRIWKETELQLLQHLGECALGRIELSASLREAQALNVQHESVIAELTGIIDAALDAVVRMDNDGVVIGWNANASATFGWSEAEAIGRKMGDLIVPPQHRAGHQRGLKHFLATGEGPILGRRIEITALHKKGHEMPVELTVTPVRVRGEWHFSAFIRDITARTRADEELKRITERFALVARATSDAVWDWDLVDNLLWWNEGFETLFGYRREEIEPGVESRSSRLHPDDVDRVMHGIHAVIDGGGAAWSEEYRFRRADGTYSDILDRGSVIRDGAGKAVRMVGAMMDLTERKESERLQRAIYRIAQAANTVSSVRDLLHQVHEIVGELLPAENFYVALHDAATNVLTFPYWADAHEPAPPPRVSGRGLTEYVLRTGAPLLVNPDVHRELERRGEIEVVGKPTLDWIGVPLKVQDRTIGVLVVQTYTEGVRYHEREVDILRFVSTQIAMAVERKRAESHLVESETRYRLLFDSNPEAMWVYDVETLRVLAVNDAAVRRYGYSRDEFLAMTIWGLRPESEFKRLRDLLRGPPKKGPRVHSDIRHQSKGGAIMDVEIASDSIVFAGRQARLVLARDITEQRQLESQLRQSQKMEAVGNLAGGVAHDFNNMLTAITGYSDLLAAEFPAGDPRRDDIDEIRAAANRAAALTQQLLAFSRKQMLQPRVLDLNKVVANAEKLLRRLIGENISLRTVLDPGIGAVRADPTQLEQVIVNLAVNARDAMPNGGELVIETQDAELDTTYTAEHSMVTPGDYVRLVVSDTGIGMDETTKGRAFEPFFTTKGAGMGTGLGLSTAYGIVKQSGGFIWLYSEIGQGTTFKVYLPRVNAPVEHTDTIPSLEVRGGNERLLLVEDEPALRAVARRALEQHGYTVLEADDGESALMVAADEGDRLQLVVSDVVMPGITGPEMAMRLAETHPDLRFLFMSGYTDDAIMRHGVLEPGVAFLQKPFTPDALARKVREVLDSAPVTPARAVPGSS